MLDTKVENKNKLVEGGLSYKINGILFEAHNELGRFAKEKQYGDLVEAKLKILKITFRRELVIGDSGNISDFNIADKIILELKAKPFLSDSDYSQVKRYLHSTGLELGILANFREKILRPKRIINQYHNL